MTNNNRTDTNTLQLPQTVCNQLDCLVSGAIKPRESRFEGLSALIGIFTIPDTNSLFFCHSHQFVNSINNNDFQIAIIGEAVFNDIHSDFIKVLPVPNRLLNDTFNSGLVCFLATGQEDITIVPYHLFTNLLDHSSFTNAAFTHQIDTVIKWIQANFSFLTKFTRHYVSSFLIFIPW